VRVGVEAIVRRSLSDVHTYRVLVLPQVKISEALVKIVIPPSLPLAAPLWSHISLQDYIADRVEARRARWGGTGVIAKSDSKKFVFQ
jgi:hypothetical protein